MVSRVSDMILKTHDCGKFKHREFSPNFDPQKILRDDAQWLCDFLQRTVAEGVRYKTGETIQIGWMINTLESRKDRSLGILEPDFVSMPINWIDSVTTTLAHFRMQRDVVESLGLEAPFFPSIRQSCIVGADLLMGQGTYDLILERSEPDDTDSGWFVGHAQSHSNYNDVANLRTLSLYELAIHVPLSVMFLALPIGFKIILNDWMLQISQFNTRLIPLAQSYLEQWLSQRKTTS